MSVDDQFHVLGSITRTTRRELILERLRSAVTSGALPPGTHLAETELSAQLGVSRGTLREALRHLQEDGLLSKDSRGRLSVRVVSPAEVADIFAVRFSLESLAIRLLNERDDFEHVITALRSALDLLRQSEEGPLEGQVDADLAFHEAICRASRNQTLVDSWRRVSGLARATITAAGRTTARENMSADRHAPILDAIASRDVEAALAVLEQHNAEAQSRIVTNMPARAAESV
ncbi:GntR family transcriptional regulator [Microbacterium sp. YY-01]|uniref:GntR family transcriptional regulator n=1 Tax=Microbacterium sp. YY-01 TaxID=3421634 RepID=UPI003D184C98